MRSIVSALVHRSVAFRVIAALCVIAGVLLVADFYRSTQPWPETKDLLTADAACVLKGRPMTNGETSESPINLSLGETLIVSGEVPQWDVPFAERSSRGRRSTTVDGRMPLLFVVFRRQGWLRNLFAGSYRYDGKTGLQVEESGNRMRFTHRVSGPHEPGTYRAQVHVIERNPRLLANMDPREAARPLGILAEALVVVE